MELFLFDRKVLATLKKTERVAFTAMARASFIPDGRPFFIGEDSLPEEELDGFCSYLLDPKRESPNTWKAYANQVAIFIRFMNVQNKSWKDATKEDLRNYYIVRTTGEFQSSPRIKGKSWNLVKSAIVHLYEYAQEVGLIRDLPFKYRKSKSIFGSKMQQTADLSAKVKAEPINFIGIKQYKESWRAELSRHRNTQRNLVLTDLLITTGLRISEALSLTLDMLPVEVEVNDIDRKSVSLRILGKGRKARNVLLPKRVLRALRFYIEEDRAYALKTREISGMESEPKEIFLSERGTKLTARAVQIVFKSVSERLGIHLTPHGCRHTFAVHQLEAMIKRMANNLKEIQRGGADAYRQVLNDPLRQLQLLLGHAQLSSTYIYLDFLEESEALVEASLCDWSDWDGYGQ